MSSDCIKVSVCERLRIFLSVRASPTHSYPSCQMMKKALHFVLLIFSNRAIYTKRADCAWILMDWSPRNDLNWQILAEKHQQHTPRIETKQLTHFYTKWWKWARLVSPSAGDIVESRLITAYAPVLDAKSLNLNAQSRPWSVTGIVHSEKSDVWVGQKMYLIPWEWETK
jgi:hypothetical protein